MRFMLQVRADRRTEAGVLPSKELIAAMGRFNEAMIKAGVMLAADGLHPSSKGVRVSFGGDKRTVIDGPFPEPKELIAGFWMIEVTSKQEAIEWAKRVPFEDGVIEIRQVFEASDFPAEILPAEAAAREQAWREGRQNRAAPPAIASDGRYERHPQPLGETMQVQPYLFFDGRCEEAVEFYRKTLGAEVQMLMRFKDSPEPHQHAPGTDDKVMHAALRIGDTTVLASDGRCLGQPNFQGFGLSLTVPDDAAAERLFAALAEGGQVQMPLGKTFFSSSFGMAADRFGVSWMVYVAP